MSDLSFDWEAVAHKSVSAIIGRNERRMSDGTLRWDALALTFGDDAVVLNVTADTDEIVVSHEPTPDAKGWVGVSALTNMLGKPLGWCWMGTNYLGYCDSFTLAFGDVVADALQPRLTFLAEGCSLSCFDVRPRNS